MLIPLSWLSEYIELNLPIEELVAKLNASGTSVEHLFSVGQGLDDLVVGQVLDVYPHPQADRLRLAKIDAGQGPVEVVCGATNLATGQNIVFAKPGSRVPVDMHSPERQSFVLQTATIRGVVSNGMICSEAELGLGDSHEGIMVLDTQAAPGTPITQVLNYPQIILDVEITTNRSDQLSMIGIAREISALTHQPLNVPTPQIQTTSSSNQTNTTLEPIIDTSDCYRLITQAMSVKVGPSPDWMQQRLQLAGMRPINNIVDITNYVMLEFGQPLHAYDIAKIQGSQLIVRPAMANETIVTLDEQSRQLPEGALVIADQQQALGIAGIMGGQASGITEQTTSIVLEAAAFSPIAIRKTANALALRSEASRRFERTVDREMTEQALLRAVELLIAHADGQVLGSKKQAYPQPVEARQISLGSRKLFQYLGQTIDPLDVRRILKSLGFEDTSASGKNNDWQIAVWVPSWRLHDIEGQEDLIEEIVRIWGYDQLPRQLPAGNLTGKLQDNSLHHKQQLSQQLAQCGWMETMSISLVGHELYHKLGKDLPSVEIANPLSSEWTHMRDSLLPSLVDVVAKNHLHRTDQPLRFFELSNVYLATGQLPKQQARLGLALYTTNQAEQAVAEMKGLIDQLLSELGIAAQQLQYQPSEQALPPFEDSALAIMVDQHIIGHLGYLSLQASQAFNLQPHLLLAELYIDQLISQRSVRQFQPINRFPEIKEDLSLLMPESEPVGPIIDIIRQAGQPLLTQVISGDTYRHPSLGSDKKSPLLHLVFHANDRTLTNQDIAPIRQAIIKALEEQGVATR